MPSLDVTNQPKCPGRWAHLKGKKYPTFVVTVARKKIKDFARAIGDLSEFYLDDAVGRASEWGDIIAPPTFAISFRNESADIGALLRDLGVDISRILHGEQEFEHYGAIRPGETYACQTRIKDIYEKTGRSGPMAFVVREVAVVNANHDVVVVMRHTAVVRL